MYCPEKVPGILCIVAFALLPSLPTLYSCSLAVGHELPRRQRRHLATQNAVVGNLRVVEVFNGAGMLTAWLDPTVGTVLLSSPSIVLDSNKLLNGTLLPAPLMIWRTVTIQGNPKLSTLPTVDLRVTGLIQLGDQVSLIFRSVVLLNPKDNYSGRIQSQDMVAPSASNTRSYIVLEDSYIYFAACYSVSMIEQDIQSTLVREGGTVHDKMTDDLPQEGCVADTSAPLPAQCWRARTRMDDLQLYGQYMMPNDTTGTPIRSNIIVWIRNVTSLCETLMDEACIREYGTPYFCYLALLQKAGSGSLAVAAAAGARGDSGNGKGRTALIAGLIGGLAGGALVVALIAMLLLRRRYHQQRRVQLAHPVGDIEKPCKTSGCSEGHDAGGKPSEHTTGGVVQCAAGKSTPRTMPAAGTVTSSMFATCELTAQPEGEHQAHQREARRGAGEPGPTMWHPPITAKVPTRSSLDTNVRLVDCPASNEHDGDARGCDLDADSRRGAQPPTPSNPRVVQLLPVVHGKGGFGRVVEGLYGGQHVAVKILIAEHVLTLDDDASKLLIASFQQEVEVLGRCQHPNIVRLLAACIAPPRLCLVMELMNTSLERVLRGPKPPMPLAKVLHIGVEVCRALGYLHPTIMHRDLKPGNVLLNDPWSDRPVVKLADFGLSRLRETVAPTEHPDAGTPAYMAPECFDIVNRSITHKADIYSLGVLLWEMLSGCKPWAGAENMAIAFLVHHRNHRLPLDKIPPSRLPRKLARLLQQCWDADPERRPAADEVGKELTLQQLREQQMGEQMQQQRHGLHERKEQEVVEKGNPAEGEREEKKRQGSVSTAESLGMGLLASLPVCDGGLEDVWAGSLLAPGASGAATVSSRLPLIRPGAGDSISCPIGEVVDVETAAEVPRQRADAEVASGSALVLAAAATPAPAHAASPTESLPAERAWRYRHASDVNLGDGIADNSGFAAGVGGHQEG